MRRRRWARRALAASGLAGLIALLGAAKAWAGTDVFSNIGPASPLGSAAAFARYPFSHYELDRHFTVVSASITGVDVSGLLPAIAWFFASMFWLGAAFLAKLVIELFAFAFSLDLVGGSSATGGAGALGPVSQAIHEIYAHVFGAPWLVLAFSGVAIWAMWKALVQRRYSETAGALAVSLIYIVIALFFVVEPGQTIGRAAGWTNELSQAFLSIPAHGTPTEGEAATADDSDQLWGLLVTQPWTVLEFGGLEHCAIDGTGDENSDPQSAPVRPLSKDAEQNSALSRQLTEGTEVAAEGKTCINNENKYASHFLRFGNSTPERDEEYEALDHGNSEELPEADEEKASYKLGVADKPATDAMEEGGQYQRLLLAPVIAIGNLGAILLLGSLAIGVILSQVLLLLLLAFSPVALVAGAIPGRGHDWFKAWLGKLGGYLLRKAAYSLVLAVLLAVNAAIAAATSQLGWLFSFGLQAAFFWAVLIQRRTLTAGIVGVATGQRSPGRDVALDVAALYAGARLGRGTMRAAGGVGRAYLRGVFDRKGAGRRMPYGATATTRAVDWSGGEGPETGGRGGGGGGKEPGGPETSGSGGGGGGGDEPNAPETSGTGGGGGDNQPDAPETRAAPVLLPLTKDDEKGRKSSEPHSEQGEKETPTDPSTHGSHDAQRRRRPGPAGPTAEEQPRRDDLHGTPEEKRRLPAEAEVAEADPAPRLRRRGKPGERPGPSDNQVPGDKPDTGRTDAGRTPARSGSGLGDELRAEREDVRRRTQERPAATAPDPVRDLGKVRGTGLDRSPYRGGLPGEGPGAASSPPRRRPLTIRERRRRRRAG